MKTTLLRCFRALALSLLAWGSVAALPASTATEPVPRDAKWVKRHEGFVEIARQGGVNVLFLGDSITDFWRNDSLGGVPRGKPVWDKDFAPLGAANFGISGDRTQHLLWRIENGELDGIKPRAIVLMIGTNNTGREKDGSLRNTPAETIEGITAVVREIRRRLPESRILLLAVFPRGQKGAPIRAEIAEINAAIAKLDDGTFVRYLDIGPKFLEPDGTLSKSIFPDLLHPNTKGYEIWAAAIQNPLAELLSVSAPAKAEDSDIRLAIVVTRHGVRSPIDRGEPMDNYSAQPWPAWEVPAGNLTPHGKEQMTLMGAYYRAWYVKEGLLSGQAERDAAQVYIRADSDQRTIETGRDLGAGLLPGAAVQVHARSPGDSDPLFSPLKAHLGSPDRARAAAAVLGAIGGNPETVTVAEAPAFATLRHVLWGDGAIAPGKISLTDLPAEIKPDRGADFVQIGGPLRWGMIFTDTLILEYADGKPLADVGWGRVDRSTLTQLLELHSLYFDLTQRTLYPAQVMGSDLASHLLQTIDQAVAGRPVVGAIGRPSERLLFLVGHDTNIANLGGLLDLSWWTNDSQRNPVLPGGAMVFELRQSRADHRYFVRAYYICQSLDQMRSGEPLTLENPPSRAPIFIPGCSQPAPGYDAPLAQFEERLRRVIDPGFVVPGSD